MSRYIPKPGERFDVFLILRTVEPNEYERFRLGKKTKYYGKSIKNGGNCLCEYRCTDYVTAIDAAGELREFDFHDFYFIKKGGN